MGCKKIEINRRETRVILCVLRPLHFKFSISVEHLRCLPIWGKANLINPMARQYVTIHGR
jgi:hypothetical protein